MKAARRDPSGTAAIDPFDEAALRPLERSFFERPVHEVARELIGKLIVRRGSVGRMLAGRIVEVEAYGGEGVDPAAHSYGGPTPRCQVMFGPAGLAYVYATQSACFCVNVTTGGKGRGRAVLIRAVEPVHGIDLMRARRLARLDEGPTRKRLESGHISDLAQGPGRLCMCLALDTTYNGADFTDARGLIYLAEEIEPAETKRRRLVWTPRIGINPKNPAAEWAWRVADKSSAAVSSRRAVRSKERREPHPPFSEVGED